MLADKYKQRLIRAERAERLRLLFGIVDLCLRFRSGQVRAVVDDGDGALIAVFTERFHGSVADGPDAVALLKELNDKIDTRPRDVVAVEILHKIVVEFAVKGADQRNMLLFGHAQRFRPGRKRRMGMHQIKLHAVHLPAIAGIKYGEA